MKFSALLLSSASIAALAVAPAFAGGAPDIHAVSRNAVMKKTSIRPAKVNSFTQTATFTESLSTAAAYKVKTVILGDTWLSHTTSGTCIFPTKQKWTLLPKKTVYAKISQSTSTGTTSSCPSTQTATFDDIVYDLQTKKAKKKTDTVTGTLMATHFKAGNGKTYNLSLNATVDIAITK